MSAARATLVAAMLAGATGPAIAEVCAVAVDGDDAKAALGAAPFATATAAVEARTVDGGWRCDEVRLAPGVYRQNLMIGRGGRDAEHPLVIAPADDRLGSVTIDGQLDTIDPRRGLQAAVAIYDAAFVTIRRLVVRNNAGAYCNAAAFPTPAGPPSDSYCNVAGIYVADDQRVPGGAGPHHVVLDGNHVTGVDRARLAVTRPGRSGAIFVAIPIAVVSFRDGLGVDGAPAPAEATHHVQLIDNVVDHCDTNADDNTVPAILVGGDVHDVLVARNQVAHIRPTAALLGSGIEIRGERAEGDAADPLRRARQVVIRDNHVRDVDIGVFVQSATDALIERNRIDDTDIGLQVMTEGPEGRTRPAGRAQRIWIRDNVFRGTKSWAVQMGMQDLGPRGYSPVDDIYVTSNTIVARHAMPDPPFDRYAVVLYTGIGGASALRGNLIFADYPHGGPNYLLRRDAPWLDLSTGVVLPLAIAVEDNLWFARGTPRTGLFTSATVPALVVTRETFARFQRWGDGRGRFVEPGLADDAGHLAPGSPAIDAGTAARVPPWATRFGEYDDGVELDCDGGPRVRGAGIDVGACEAP